MEIAAPLPELIWSHLIALQDGPDAEFWPGVARLCQSHPSLEPRIREEAAGLQRLATAGNTTLVGTSVGPYHVLALVGKGGMGEVYKAERREPVRQLVALKVVKPGMATFEVLARFQLERRALAAMHHGSIAKVLDAGATTGGEPYFVMEFIAGLPLTDYSDKHTLSVPARLALMQQVCAGVHHAHQKGIVHRDLKPGNVLVVREDADAVAKVLDFGLAKATSPTLGGSFVTAPDRRGMGTLEYMSPEQATGDAEEVDARTDIYALGVMLYELLVGELPFTRDELCDNGDLEALRVIREREPSKPSTRFSGLGERMLDVARRRQTTPVALSRELRGDLDWVVMKAMAKEPERRYDSAAALAQDLARYLTQEPVSAGPPRAGYRLRKFAQRYRVQLTATALVLVALLAGVIGITVFWLDARDQATQLSQRKHELDLLARALRVQAATAQAQEKLYPPWPHSIEPMQSWLRDDCDQLVRMRPEIEAVLSAMRRDQLPAVKGTSAGTAPRFADAAQQFLYDSLDDLHGRLADLTATRLAVEVRLGWAEQIEHLTLRHPLARASWEDARSAVAKADDVVASHLYRCAPPIELTPQMGLVPIGMNPATKLWEFYELRSAWDGASEPARIPIPGHIADSKRLGEIELTEATGIVFVLVPGGTFTMGASMDTQDAHYDPLASLLEEPPHRVTVEPFFIARHEITQAQWRRLTGLDPSNFKAGGKWHELLRDGLNPVEQVSWEDCSEWLPRYGMALPTEAQWEHACRATSTGRWTCEFAALRHFANVADQTDTETTTWKGEAWVDGYVEPGPVGDFKPNAFGLHDVHGNVLEWVADPWRPYAGSAAPNEVLQRVARGGCYYQPARSARITNRNRYDSRSRNDGIGVRPARAFQGRAAASETRPGR